MFIPKFVPEVLKAVETVYVCVCVEREKDRGRARDGERDIEWFWNIWIVFALPSRLHSNSPAVDMEPEGGRHRGRSTAEEMTGQRTPRDISASTRTQHVQYDCFH